MRSRISSLSGAMVSVSCGHESAEADLQRAAAPLEHRPAAIAFLAKLNDPQRYQDLNQDLHLYRIQKLYRFGLSTDLDSIQIQIQYRLIFNTDSDSIQIRIQYRYRFSTDSDPDSDPYSEL